MYEDKIIIDNLEKTILGMRERLKNHTLKVRARDHEIKVTSELLGISDRRLVEALHKNEEANVKLNELDKELMNWRSKFLNLSCQYDRDVGALNRQKAELNCQVNNLKKEIEFYKNQSADIQVSTLQHHMHHLRRKNEDQQELLKSRAEEIRDLQSKIEETPGYQAMELEIIKLREANAAQEELLRSRAKKIEDLQSINPGYQSMEILKLQKEKESIIADFRKLAGQRDMVQADLTQAFRVIEKLHEEAKQCKKALYDLAKNRDECLSRASKVVDEAAKKHSKSLDECVKELNILRCRITQLSCDYNKATNAREETRCKLDKLWVAVGSYLGRSGELGEKLVMILKDTKP